MDPFSELLERVKSLTKLNGREASAVAADLYDEDNERPWSAPEIVERAQSLGYQVDKPAGVKTETAIGAEISMDPAHVLSEVYENQPRVLCANMPVIGKAPAELQQLAPELVEELPDEIVAMLVKVDLFEGKATFWLRDEANDIDRPIGPIDLSRYGDENAMRNAFTTLIKRLPRVLAADFN